MIGWEHLSTLWGCTGLQDAWQEALQGTSDFCSWYWVEARQQLHQSWQQLQQSAPQALGQFRQQLQQQLQLITPVTAFWMAVVILAAAAAVRGVLRERHVSGLLSE